MERCRREEVNELQLLIPDKGRKQVVVIPKGGKYVLPQCFGEWMAAWDGLGMMKEEKKILGFDLEVTILRWIWTRNKSFGTDDSTVEYIRSVIVFETHEDSCDLPQGWQWVNIDEANIDHDEDEGRRCIREELDGILEGTEPELRVAWGREGWFKETSEWICEVLRSHGLDVKGKVVQLRATVLSTVLRANTGNGYYFLKCTPVFCNEAAIAAVLCRAAPSCVVRPLVIDTERRITISADHGKEWSSWSENRIRGDDETQALRDLVKLQKVSMSVMEDLVAAGLKVYSAKWMKENLDFLLEHEELQFMKESDVLKNLKRSKNRVRQVLCDIENRNLPATLVHGDLGQGNICRPGGETGPFCFFDWNVA